MAVVGVRDAPRAYWNHIRGCRQYESYPAIPQIAGIPWSRDLVHLINSRRRSSSNYTSAARSARLAIRRWSPSLLPGERQSRPEYQTLLAIRGYAFSLVNFPPELVYPSTTANLLYLQSIEAWRVPFSYVTPSVADTPADLENWAWGVLEYSLSGATLLVTEEWPVDENGNFFYSAWLVWESGANQIDYSRLDTFQG